MLQVGAEFFTILLIAALKSGTKIFASVEALASHKAKKE